MADDLNQQWRENVDEQLAETRRWRDVVSALVKSFGDRHDQHDARYRELSEKFAENTRLTGDTKRIAELSSDKIDDVATKLGTLITLSTKVTVFSRATAASARACGRGAALIGRGVRAAAKWISPIIGVLAAFAALFAAYMQSRGGHIP